MLKLSDMKKTVLVIEDEQDMRDLLEDALNSADFRVYLARDGKEGLELAAEHEPDVIILDLLLPQVGGQDVLKAIRGAGGDSQPKVIILSAMEDVGNVGEAYETGISDYIIKSETSPTEIIAKVHAVLNQT